jgi:hypothetical protein
MDFYRCWGCTGAYKGCCMPHASMAAAYWTSEKGQSNSATSTNCQLLTAA